MVSSDTILLRQINLVNYLFLHGRWILVFALFSISIVSQSADGDADPDFAPSVSNVVRIVKQQSDGKILIGGTFKLVESTTRNGLARYDIDGSLDTNFNPNMGLSINPLFAGTVVDIVEQSDTQLIVVGGFSSVNGISRRRIARISSAGVLDINFTPEPDFNVSTVALETDGDVVFGGDFSNVSGSTRNKIARVDSEGSLDIDFSPSFNAGVSALLIQSDGKIVVGGFFTEVNGLTRNYLARLNSDGSLDTGFNPNLNGGVNAVAEGADGSIYIGGDFSTVGGAVRNNLAKLSSMGVLDASFNPNVDDIVYDIEILNDGNLIIGGVFDNVGGVVRASLAKITPNGDLDELFKANTGPNVISVEEQSDSQIVIGGLFSRVNGVSRDHLAKLEIGIGDISISTDHSSLPEGSDGSVGSTSYEFVITRTENALGASSVNFEVMGVGENAADATDFGGAFPSGTVNFSVNEASQTIHISIFGDDIVEPDESFIVTLSDPVNANLIDATAEGVIADDDREDQICFPVVAQNGAAVLLCL